MESIRIEGHSGDNEDTQVCGLRWCYLLDQVAFLCLESSVGATLKIEI